MKKAKKYLVVLAFLPFLTWSFFPVPAAARTPSFTTDDTIQVITDQLPQLVRDLKGAADELQCEPQEVAVTPKQCHISIDAMANVIQTIARVEEKIKEITNLLNTEGGNEIVNNITNAANKLNTKQIQDLLDSLISAVHALGVTLTGIEGALNDLKTELLGIVVNITSITPSSAPAGSTVQIRGAGFTPKNNTVTMTSASNSNISTSVGGLTAEADKNAANVSIINFQVPQVAAGPGTYKVKVSNDNGVSPEVNFTVAGAVSGAITITSLSPLSGLAGSTVTIFGTGFADSGNIVHFGNNLITPSNVTNAPASGQPYLQFQVPNVESGTYSVWITAGSSASNILSFQVLSAASQAPLTVIFPNGGETLVTGQSYDIKWATSQNIQPSAQMAIKLDKGGNEARLISASAPNNGIFRWTVPIDVALGNDYKVRINCLSGCADNATDSSDGNFVITNQAGTPPPASQSAAKLVDTALAPVKQAEGETKSLESNLKNLKKDLASPPTGPVGVLVYGLSITKDGVGAFNDIQSLSKVLQGIGQVVDQIAKQFKNLGLEDKVSVLLSLVSQLNSYLIKAQGSANDFIKTVSPLIENQ